VHEDDPFAAFNDPAKTILRPNPGGRRGVTATGIPPVPRPPTPGAGEVTVLPTAASDNPLVACAGDLLSLAGALRGSASHPDPSGLREQLVQQIRAFEACARGRGLADTQVLPARYVLCALLDEAVRDTPWGSESIFTNQGLLVSFHREVWGGEKFFEALNRLLAYPAGNLHLLELMYLCLAQGFEGRYRVREGGRDQLDQIRAHLYQTIRSQRGEPEPALSPRWQGVRPQRDPLLQQVPLWVLSALAALLLLGLFTAFSLTLGRASDPVFLALASLDRGIPDPQPRPQLPTPVATPAPTPAPVDTGPPPLPRLTLRQLLREDIAAGRVEVSDEPEGERITIRGDGLFASAQASLTPTFLPIVNRIGEALAQLPGEVLVTGHTDSLPIRTLRFPSNFELSQARADAVTAKLAEISSTPGRFRAEGRAESEPAVPDNPRDARNRRVEVTLLHDHAELPDQTGAQP